MVKLVDYPDSSDDEQIPADAGMKSDSEWSSFGEPPSDSGDSFSFQMGSPEPSDIENDEEDDGEDGDEDYVPSASSSSPPSSPTSSDLEPSPRCSFDEEKPRTSLFRGFSAADTDTTTSTDERGSSEESTAAGRTHSVNGSTANSAKSDSKTMFYAWSDLSAAFEENPFKRRSVVPGNGSFTMKPNVGEANKATETTEDHLEDENMAAASPMEAAHGDDHDLQHDHESTSLPAHAESAFDRVQGRWGSHPPAGNTGFGAEGSVRQEEQPGSGKKARQRSQRHEPFRRHPSGISPKLTKASSEKQSRATADESTAFHFTFESMTHEKRNEGSSTAGATRASSFNGFPSQAKMSFGFGLKPTAASSSSFKPTSFSFETPDATKLDSSIDDTPMRSPSPPATSATSSSNDDGFLFGWGYKNRKPFAFADQGGNGAFDSTFDSTATQEAFNEDTAASLRAQASANGATTSRFGENRAPKAAPAAFFTPGVADSTQPQRSRGDLGHRRKLNGSSATPSPPQANANANASKMPPPPPAFTLFGASHFPPAASYAHAPHESSFATSTGTSTASWENAFGQHPAATEPGPPPAPKVATSVPFVFGKTSAAEFTAAGSSSMRSASAFDSRNPTTAAPVNPNIGASTQFSFGMEAPRTTFLFGHKEPADSHGVNRPAPSFEPQPGTTFGLGNPPPPRVNTQGRRILRAVHRSAEVHTNDTSNSSSGDLEEDEGDAEMESDEDDRDWGELKRLGGVAYSAKQYADAAEYYRQSIEVLESLLDRDPEMETHELITDKAKLHANRAASLMMLMQIPEAQRECRRSIEVDPSYTRAYLRLGRIQVLLGDTTHAQTNLDTAKQLMAEKMGEEDSNDRADQASVLKMEATIKKLSTLQGEIRWCVDVGDFKQALSHTENALALAPSSRKLQVQKVRILLQQKAKTVDEIAFVGIDLGLLWAKTLHYQNKVEDAVRILGALEVVAPCSSHVIQLKRQWQDMKQLKHNGNERFKRGEYREAVRFYSEAVEIDAQHDEYCAIIYCNRAAAQMGLERYHTALRDCDEALQRKAQYSRALLRRARCYVALSKFQEAVKDFDRYLREHPGDSSSGQAEDIRRERNEAKAAIAKTREEARKREAAKKRAEREQRQRRAQHWDQSWDDSKFYENFRRGSSSSSSSRFKSAGASGRSSFMEKKTQRRTHYDVLGLEKVATCDQIKKAYRKLALVYHPDKSNTASHVDLFKEMTAAYNVLSDESARAKYDRELVYSRFGNFYEN
ncbi:hypothetical protein BBJ28_00018276 [Nothophytophthora sp. Chile5]|nr:hypothetical protein BBJ28_00018276 [Nothophytophthora sp. Chile5]